MPLPAPKATLAVKRPMPFVAFASSITTMW